MKDNKRYNSSNKLIREYQSNYYRYMQASERYDQLVRAYTSLIHSKKEASFGNIPDSQHINLSQMEKNLKRMIKKAYIEKNTIAEHARECLRNHRKKKAEKIHFRVNIETADQWV